MDRGTWQATAYGVSIGYDWAAEHTCRSRSKGKDRAGQAVAVRVG